MNGKAGSRKRRDETRQRALDRAGGYLDWARRGWLAAGAGREKRGVDRGVGVGLDAPADGGLESGGPGTGNASRYRLQRLNHTPRRVPGVK